MTGNPSATILVVDDRDDTRPVISAMLRQAGYQVREARSGAHAVHATTDRPDLVVRCVTGDLAVAPVLELSAGDRGPGEGVDARVSLPVTPGRLAATVEAVLRVHRWEAVRRSVFEITLDAVVVADDTGRLLDVNEASCLMFRAPKTELVGRRLGEFLDHGVDFEQAWQTLREWGWRMGELRLVLTDGAVREVEYVARANVLPGRHLALLRDITRQRQWEAAAGALIEVGRLMSETADVRQVARRIAEATCALLGVQSAAVFRLDPESGDVVVLALARDAAEILNEGFVFPRGAGVVGAAVRERRPVATPDVLNDSHVALPPELRARLERSALRAVLALPLMVEGTVIGALAARDRVGRMFDGEAIRLASAFADQAALALEKARLAEEQAKLLRETRRQREEAVALEAVARQHAARLRVLREIDQGILAARSAQGIAETALGRLAGLVPCWRASVSIFDAETGEGHILAVIGGAQNVAPAGSPSSITREDVEYLQQGKIRLVQDVDTSDDVPPMVRALQGEGLRAYLRVPLLADGELIGSLNLSTDRPAAFRAEHVEIATDVGELLAVALQQARLNEAARVGRERLQALSRRLVEVQEGERRHIARELHDEIGQILTGLKLALEKSVGRPDAAIRADLERAMELVTDLITRVRDLSLDLRPAMLDDLGLVPSLVWHFERYTEQTSVTVNFEQVGVAERRFQPDIETAAYRIVQEALTNAARHAVVTSATVRIWADERALGVQVEDKGVGFAPEVAPAQTRGGLAGMRERVTLLGGHFELESSPGAGTRLTAEIPLR